MKAIAWALEIARKFIRMLRKLVAAAAAVGAAAAGVMASIVHHKA